jgi:hypothetical protein
MSVTTTANSEVVTLRQTLAEYELHHSETNPNPEVGSAAPAPNSVPVETNGNPAGWDTTHRRVPDFRPVRRENINEEGRNVYNNGIERAFVWTMLNGVGVQAVRLHFASAESSNRTTDSLLGCGTSMESDG